MGGENELQLYAESEEAARNISDSVIADVRAVETKYSRYLDDSVVSRINAAAGRDSVEVDDETAGLLDYAHACYLQSDGLFDITSGILRRAWDFKSGRVPQQQEIDELLPLIGWKKVRWQRPRFGLALEGMQIDFGGFGKEYAVDRAAHVLQSLGVGHGLVNLGGDLRVIGGHPGGGPWMIGVVHPRTSGAVLRELPLREGGVATSGDYERFMIVDGARYSHILNPKTGWPVKSFQSVSVVSESCLIAGSASTISMLKGEKRGLAFLRGLELPFFCVGSAGEEIISSV